ncbi:ABC transporter ATP-binding protein [Marinobacterium marinum]|uniref:ABC transporter ATP-binding protein n=1 Tax=Marinobacterium marinum TaxID=2756129 RepID=A0A7W2ABF2_9GAMM|nr:ABC transporter ATP-binding protein [Marinobacterium marinum]MBA4500998.1 ABC transporter ATP-binding protein [Marinobacterium marinum]
MQNSNHVVLDVKDLGKVFSPSSNHFSGLLEQLLPNCFKKSDEGFVALDTISFEVRRGETVGIIGRNGSGKSTLLQIICGTITPTSGSIYKEGRIAALLELGAGFNPEYTGRENVKINASIYGLTKREIDSKMQSIIDFSEIGDFIDQPVKHYSSGMFVRLAFSVIVHVDADVLIIDEALAVGDILFSQKCIRFLKEFRQRGSILFVSHDSGAISQLCDRVLWIDSGIQKGLGDTATVLDQYLEFLYSTQQETQPVQLGPLDESKREMPALFNHEPWYDARKDVIETSNLSNHIEICKFEAQGQNFGDGAVSIFDAFIRDANGRKLIGVTGGSQVAICFSFFAHQDIESVIVGFLIKDRCGQVIIGDNNCIIHHENPPSVEKGKRYEARFGITLPYLAVSEYTISISVASGNQADHVQHCWNHNAIIFYVEKGPVAHGIFGVPLEFCSLELIEDESV